MRWNNDGLTCVELIRETIDDNLCFSINHLNEGIKRRDFLRHGLSCVKRKCADISRCFFIMVLITTVLGIYAIMSMIITAFAFSISEFSTLSELFFSSH